MAQPTTATVDQHWLSARDRSVIAILLVAAFVVILNETALNVALTSIMADLRVDERTVQWLTTAFMLTMAVVIPVTGWLLERIPTRSAFVLAMSLFTAGTLVCAVAPIYALVLLGRIIQASGTAIMLPLLMTTVMQLVPPAHRGAIMGNISMVISVAPAVGPTMAGIVLQFTSWRGVFALMVPIGLAMLIVGALAHGQRQRADPGAARRLVDSAHRAGLRRTGLRAQPDRRRHRAGGRG